jgi:hypothetical protein
LSASRSNAKYEQARPAQSSGESHGWPSAAVPAAMNWHAPAVHAPWICVVYVDAQSAQVAQVWAAVGSR